MCDNFSTVEAESSPRAAGMSASHQSPSHPNGTADDSLQIHCDVHDQDLKSLGMDPIPVIPPPPMSDERSPNIKNSARRLNSVESSGSTSDPSFDSDSPGKSPDLTAAVMSLLLNNPSVTFRTCDEENDCSSPSEIRVDLDALNSTSEIAKVLENFNSILEKIEKEDADTFGSKDRAEAFADLLIGGEADGDEELLIIVDENDPEAAGLSLDQFGAVALPKNVEEEENLSTMERDIMDADHEEGYESDRPMVRASMRRLRPVQMLPIPQLPTIPSPPDNPPPSPTPGVTGLATTLNSPVTNRILVTSLMNNVLNAESSSVCSATTHTSELPCSSSTIRCSDKPVPITTKTSEIACTQSTSSSHSQDGESGLLGASVGQTHVRAASLGANSVGLQAVAESLARTDIQSAGNSSSGSQASVRSPSTSNPSSPPATANSSPNNENVTPAQPTTASTNSATPAPATASNTNSTSTSGRTRNRTERSIGLGPGMRMPAGRWPHRLSSVLALMGCTLGLNNICRFALLSVQYGANFILQFVFLSLVFGIPLFTFHMSIGQYLSSGIIDMWKISPIFQGIGVGLVISQAMIGIYTAVGVSWIFIYFRDSFITRYDQYRWGRCFPDYRDCDQHQYYQNTTAHLVTTVPDYFNGVVLQRTNPSYPDPSAAYAPSSLKFTVAFNLAVVWMLVFVSLSKGLKSYGKVVHGFVLAPIAALIVLASKMVGLVPAEEAGSLFGQTAWSTFFFNSQTWVVAAREAFFTWGLLGACIMQVTSHNRFTHSLKSDASIVVLVTTFVLLLSAFLGNACYSVLLANGYTYQPSSFESDKTYGFLIKSKAPDPTDTPSYMYQHTPFLMGVRITKSDLPDEHVVSGYQVLRLATELFPTTMAILGPSGLSPFWTVLFYFTFVLFGIAQQLAIWHCVIKGVIAIKSKVLRSWETTITFCVCALGFVLGLPLCTETGIFVEYFLDYAIGCGWWIMVLYLLELVAVFIVRGAPYCGENIVTVLFTGPGKLVALLAPLVSFVWNVILPVAMLVLSIASFKSGNIRELYDWNPAHGYAFWPSWTRELGSLIQLLPILAVPFVAIVQSCRYLTNGPPDLFERMQQLYRPTSRGLLRRTSGQYAENGTSPDGSNRGTNGSRTEDPPPKYTPPPSYSTATGAKIAKFLRNSFRRSLRRLSSPGGPSTSSTSTENLPPPPNYASVVLEINSQMSQCAEGTSSCDASGNRLMVPIMISPPPEYNDNMLVCAQVQSHSQPDNSTMSKKNVSQTQLSQTLGRALGQSLESSTGKERASLRRIASDITPRNIARMLRASFRRGSVHQTSPDHSAEADSEEASTSAAATAVETMSASNLVNFQVGSDLSIFSADLNHHAGSSCSYANNPTSTNSIVASNSSSNLYNHNLNFGLTFGFDASRNRNSNDSQLALISSGAFGYSESDVDSSSLVGLNAGIVNPTFHLQRATTSLQQPHDSEA